MWQYYRDKPVTNDAGAFIDFTANDDTDSFKFKQKLTDKTGHDGTKNLEIMVPLKYLSNFWRTLKIPLISCKTKLILTWSASCFVASLTAANQVTTFAVTDTRLYVPVVTLSADNNAKLLQQLNLPLRRTINLDKFQSKATKQMRNQCLCYITDRSFLLGNRRFVMSFENGAFRTLHTSYRFKLWK